MRHKKLLAVMLLAVCSFGLYGCGASDTAKTTEAAQEEQVEETNQDAQDGDDGQGDQAEDAQAEEGAPVDEQMAAEPIGIHHAEITVENYGTMKVELDGDTAPITVQNFMDLAKSGFYDGLTFHRIMDGFMIQGGDPLGNGTGGSEKTIKGEFSENGVKNDISHKTGVISMARANDPDSASSQFFIMVADADFLDGMYAGFGHVTEGVEIALQIAKDANPVDNNGTIPAEDQPVITSIVITD